MALVLLLPFSVKRAEEGLEIFLLTMDPRRRPRRRRAVFDLLPRYFGVFY